MVDRRGSQRDSLERPRGSGLIGGDAMKTKKSRAAWMAMLLLASLSSAAVSAEKPADLRKQIAKTEQEFFALYNKPNTDPQSAMVCKRERAGGTVFATRVCQPQYVEAAQQANA